MSSHSPPDDILDHRSLDASQLPTRALKVDLLKRLNEVDYVEDEASEKKNADVGEPRKVSSGDSGGRSPETDDALKNNDDGDLDPPEKPSLGRRSGDDTIEEDSFDSKQMESDCAEPAAIIDDVRKSGISGVEREGFVNAGDVKPLDTGAHKNTLTSAKRKFDREAAGNNYAPKGKRIRSAGGGPKISEPPNNSSGTDFVRFDGYNDLLAVDTKAFVNNNAPKGKNRLSAVEGSRSSEPQSGTIGGSSSNSKPSVFDRLSGFNSSERMDNKAAGNHYAPKRKRVRRAGGGPKISEPQSGAVVGSTMPSDSSGTDYVAVDRKAFMNNNAPKGKHRLSAVEGSKSSEPQSGAGVGSSSTRHNNSSSPTNFERLTGLSSEPQSRAGVGSSSTRPNNSSSPSVFEPLTGLNSPERMVLPPSKRPTNSLRIDGFVRPLALKAVQKLLLGTGTLTSFWMDSIKTHCYVSFLSAEEAVATHNAVNNLEWQLDSGRTLVAEFVDPEEVKIRAESTPVSPTERANISTPPPREARMEDFFLQTSALPKIFYLPLTDEQVAEKKNRDVDEWALA